MDADGRIAAHTGRECVDWCGHVEGDGFSIAGNMLAGAAVLDDTAKAYAANAKLPFRTTADRGDEGRRSRRRRQARQTVGGASDPWRGGMVRRSTCASTTTPIRSPNSSGWKQVSRERWVHFRNFLPTRKNPAGITDRATIDAAHRSRDCEPAMTAGPLIEIEGLRVVFHGDDGRTTHAVDSVDLSVANGATLGLVGEIRLRQERDLARHHGAVVEALRRSHRLDPLRRFRSARSARRDPARPARQSARDDLSGADDLAQPEFYHRRPDHRDHPAPSRRLAARRRASAPSSCCAASTSPRPKSASTNIRTSSPAACASA